MRNERMITGDLCTEHTTTWEVKCKFANRINNVGCDDDMQDYIIELLDDGMLYESNPEELFEDLYYALKELIKAAKEYLPKDNAALRKADTLMDTLDDHEVSVENIKKTDSELVNEDFCNVQEYYPEDFEDFRVNDDFD